MPRLECSSCPGVAEELTKQGSLASFKTCKTCGKTSASGLGASHGEPESKAKGGSRPAGSAAALPSALHLPSAPVMEEPWKQPRWRAVTPSSQKLAITRHKNAPSAPNRHGTTWPCGETLCTVSPLASASAFDVAPIYHVAAPLDPRTLMMDLLVRKNESIFNEVVSCLSDRSTEAGVEMRNETSNMRSAWNIRR